MARTPISVRRCTPTAHGAPGLAQAEQLHGKEMSYNNYIDSDAARRAAYDHTRSLRGDHQARQPVRHRHRESDIAAAYRKAFECDPVSAFGGVVATNRPVTARDGRSDG